VDGGGGPGLSWPQNISKATLLDPDRDALTKEEEEEDGGRGGWLFRDL